MTNSTSAAKTIYTYLYSSYDFNLDSMSVNFTISQAEILTTNDRLIVLDDHQFTRICTDGTTYMGCSNLNEPSLYVYDNDPCYGNGILFHMTSDVKLEGYEVKDIISGLLKQKAAAIENINYDSIDEAFSGVAF